jgi:hypothetical protein
MPGGLSREGVPQPNRPARTHSLRRSWIGLTIKRLIGYGSGVSASRRQDISAKRHSLGRIVALC